MLIRRNPILLIRTLPLRVKVLIAFFICSFLQKGISILTTPIFTRLLSAQEYGRFNVFSAWVGIITIIVTLNLFYGVYTQGLVKYEQERSIFSSSLQGLTLCLVLGWTIIYGWRWQFWNHLFNLSTVQMLLMLVMIWTTAVFSFWSAEQRVRLKYKRLVVTILVSFGKPIVGVLFVTGMNDKVTARILGLVLVELIGYTGLFVRQMYQGRQFFSKRFWWRAMVFNIPLLPHFLSQLVLSGADRIMIERMVDAKSAGIYSLAYSIAQIMLMVNIAFQQTINPWIYEKIKTQSIENIAVVGYIAMLAIASVNIVLIAIAPEIVSLFAPPAYRDAIWIIPPVALSSLFIFAYDLFAMFELYYERTIFITIASVCAAILNISLNLLLIPLFGYYVAGYTTLICYILYAIGHYLMMQHVCRQTLKTTLYNTRVLVMIAGGFIIIGILLLSTYSFPLVRYPLMVGLVVLMIYSRQSLIRSAKLLRLVRLNH
ncbi:oligosaccharide flippase family protein [Lactiplantibacillus sp. DA1]|nr:oligosaccharide flippase family protein [Lactiplantibacillus sp. DA1]MDV0430138.1 oligosaccharide flippase family protein [Lactiplantibacillus sp. DA1]